MSSGERGGLVDTWSTTCTTTVLDQPFQSFRTFTPPVPLAGPCGDRSKRSQGRGLESKKQTFYPQSSSIKSSMRTSLGCHRYLDGIFEGVPYFPSSPSRTSKGLGSGGWSYRFKEHSPGNFLKKTFPSSSLSLPSFLLITQGDSDNGVGTDCEGQTCSCIGGCVGTGAEDGRFPTYAVIVRLWCWFSD